MYFSKNLSKVIFFLFIPAFVLPLTSPACEDDPFEKPAVTNLRNYLRIRTHPPNPEYQEAIQWLEEQAVEIGLKFQVVNLGIGSDGNQAVIMQWPGINPKLNSLLFNNHMDVVKADAEKWKYPPFEACKDADGKIYGRGAIDMKANTVGVLEAVKLLKGKGMKPLRTIYVTVLPDEETGGKKGMKPFLETEAFKNLHVGLAVDECGGNWERNWMRICFTEKAAWQFNVTVRGEPGHGSTLPEITAGHRLQTVIDRLFEYRQKQYDNWENGVSMETISTVNLVGVGGGTQQNIIAAELWAAFDMRVKQRANWRFQDAEALIEKTLKEAELGEEGTVSLEWLLKTEETGETRVDDGSLWWRTLQNACEELDINCPPVVLNGISDARYLRNRNISVFGLAPFLNTPGTAHKHNEFIHQIEFLKGIQRYAVLIQHFASAQE